MRCQTCVALGANDADFDENAIDDLKSHAEFHRTQMSEGEESSENMLLLCFPKIVDAIFGNSFDETEAIIETTLRDICTYVEKKLEQESIEGETAKRVMAKVETAVIQSKKRRKCKSESATHQFCTQLIEEFGFGAAKKKRRLKCRLCSSKILVPTYLPAINHATGRHLQKPLYTCRLCSKDYFCYLSMTGHIYSSHKRSIVGNYVDNSIVYEDEIIDSLAECYGGLDDENGERKKFKEDGDVKKEKEENEKGKWRDFFDKVLAV